MLSNIRTVLVCIVVVLVLALVGITGGCGRAAKGAKETAEAVRVAKDAQDGSFTVKGEKGEELKVDASKEGGKSGSWSMTDEKGQTTTSEWGANTVTQEDVGIGFYPGATVVTGVKADTTGAGGTASSTALLETPDPFDKVATFYRGKYGKGNTVIEGPGNLMITIDAGENKGKMIIVGENKEKGVTTIAIQASASSG